MDKSLGKSVEFPKHTKLVIQQSLKTKVGADLVWIVVEAEDDADLYGKFMDSTKTNIQTSLGPDGKRRGYANVENIVREINKENPNAKIFGIRDRDYSQFSKSRHIIPDNVFITDERDMEMTLMADEVVRKNLSLWKPGFDAAFSKIEHPCRYLGYVRIANEVLQLSIIFRKEGLEAKRIWDNTLNCLKTDWKKDINKKFFSSNNEICSVDSFEAFRDSNCLNSESTYKVCRGHDVIYLLARMLPGADKKIILQKMIDFYDYSRFSLSYLKKEIEVWSVSNNATVLKGS